MRGAGGGEDVAAAIAVCGAGRGAVDRVAAGGVQPAGGWKALSRSLYAGAGDGESSAMRCAGVGTGGDGFATAMVARGSGRLGVAWATAGGAQPGGGWKALFASVRTNAGGDDDGAGGPATCGAGAGSGLGAGRGAGGEDAVTIVDCGVAAADAAWATAGGIHPGGG